MAGDPKVQQSDKPAERRYVKGITGRDFDLGTDTEHAAAYAERGGQIESKEQAQSGANAQRNLDYVNAMPAAEKAAAGFGSGLTLGLGPAALAGLGIVDEGTLNALGESGAYQAGDVAGMIAPALLTGGEGLAARGAIAGAEGAERGLIAKALANTPAGFLNRAGGGVERLVGGVLPEAGVFGKLARPTLQMAARGATEGALINLAHTSSENIIHDHPFTAQALAASAADGALFGGLAGGVLGGAGALAGAGTEAIAGAVGGVGAGGERGAVRALRRLGADEKDFGRLLGQDGGNLGALKGYGKILEEGGASFASKDDVILKVSKNTVASADAVKSNVIKTLDDEARSMVPEVGRVEARVQADLASAAPVQQGKIAKAFAGLQEDLDNLANRRPKDQFTMAEPVEPQPFQHPGEPAPAKPYDPQWQPREAKPFSKPEPVKPVDVKGAVPMSPADKQAYANELKAWKAEKAAHEAAEGERFSVEKKAQDHAAKTHGASEAERISKESKAISASEKAHNAAEKARYAAERETYESAKKAHSQIPDFIRHAGSDGTWAGWAGSRDALAEMAGKSSGVQKMVYESALNAMDAEIRTAMETASKTIGKDGLAAQYQAAVVQRKLASEMSDMIESRIAGKASTPGTGLHSGDIGTMAYGTLAGHPIGAAAIVAGKKVVGHVQNYLEPVMAEAAYRMAIGSRAAGAAAKITNSMRSGVKAYIKNTANAGVQQASKEYAGRSMSVDGYQRDLEATQKLLDYTHQAKVELYAKQMAEAGHPEMGQESLEMYQRAAAYLNYNMPVSAKTKKASSLGKMPKPFGFSTKESRFGRISAAIKNPMILVDGLADGTVSRDQVKAVKYVMPDFHKELVSNTMSELLAMKQDGETIPADKIAMLGLVLDAPIDSKLESGFIDAVQSAHVANNAPPPPEGKAGAPVPVTDTSSFQTPLQQSLG